MRGESGASKLLTQVTFSANGYGRRFSSRISSWQLFHICKESCSIVREVMKSSVDETSEVLDKSTLHVVELVDRPSRLVEPRYRSWAAKDSVGRMGTWERLRHQKMAPFESLFSKTTQRKHGERESWRKIVRGSLAWNRTLICTSAVIVLSGMLIVDLWLTSYDPKGSSFWTEPLKQRYPNPDRRNQSAVMKQPLARGQKHPAVPKKEKDSAAVAATSTDMVESEINGDKRGSRKTRGSTVTQREEPNVKKNGVHSRTKFAGRQGERSVDASAVPKTIHRSSIRNGTMYEIPASWSRFFVPWFVPYQTFKLNSVSEARNRILYSPTKHMMSDGIGHSMASLNYEIRVAHGFGLAYSHRVSMYSSLSVDKPLAVEEFFGWGERVPAQRRQLMRQVCRSESKNDKDWAADKFERRFECNTCASIRQGNALGIEKLVELPPQLCIKCVGGRPYRSSDLCARERSDYVKRHNDSNTLFQLPLKDCAVPVSDAQFGDTKHYFFHKYWERHAFPKSLAAMMKREVQERNVTRSMKLVEHELNIAVHVRRGDFFNPEVRIKRKMFADEAYATLICRVLQVVGEVGGVFAELPVRVHIFSEGRVVSTGISTHSVASQNNKYYDFNGAPRDARWWERLIARTARQQLKHARHAGADVKPQEAASLRWKDLASLVSVLQRTSVRLRISEPTLASMHEMASADVFIGSKSGLSTNAVWALARGVSLLPQGAPVNSEGMAGGRMINRICCTVSFDSDTFDFDAAKLLEYWRAFSDANSNSARAAVAAAKAKTRE